MIVDMGVSIEMVDSMAILMRKRVVNHDKLTRLGYSFRNNYL